MKFLIISLLFLIFGSLIIAQDKTFNFYNDINLEIKNPADLYRMDEMVKINISEIKTLIRDFNENAFIVYSDGMEVPSQILNVDGKEKIVFIIDLKPNADRIISIKYLKEGTLKKQYKSRTYAELAMKFDAVYKEKKFTGKEFQNFSKVIVPEIHTDHDALFKYEGPGWESELVGYRFYLDWRNATDIFGKKVNELVLHKVGNNDVIATNDSYHEMQDWGMDILKVGNTLGIGSIGMTSNGKINMVSKTEKVICEISANGPIISEVKTDYLGWAVEDQKYDLTAIYNISAGSRITNAELKIKGNAENITTGIAKHENTEYFFSSSDGEWQYIALYGQQSLSGDKLGIGVFYPKSDLIEVGEDELNYFIMLRPDNNSIRYKYTAAWEQEKYGLKSLSEFKQYMNDEIEKLNNPIRLEIKVGGPMNEFTLHEDRFFDPDPIIRKTARELYQEIKDLPIIAPHGHVDPKIFVDNNPFPNPAELFITPDHYVFRMLYAQGIHLDDLNIPDKTGNHKNKDPRDVWQIFADNYYLFNGTPSGVWLDYEFNKVFGITEKLNGENAQKIFDTISEKLQSEEFLPRNLYDKFKIEVLTTTDAAVDDLRYHKEIKASEWGGRIIPCFRPDSLTDLGNPNWMIDIRRLEESTSFEITSYQNFIRAIEMRREYFISVGATSTDHGVVSPFTHRLENNEAEEIFAKALKNGTSKAERDLFTAHMLMEMARMSSEDGMTMQIHAGSSRNHNSLIYDKYGLDKGCDIPQNTEYTYNLKELLNTYGNNPNFALIIFTLDETNYSRELAPLAGHYPAMKLGPAWWFHDSIEGMTRYRQMVTETAGFYNTVGFNDDTRAFVSIPARHDVARRVDANFLGGLVARHIISIDEAKVIMKDLTYNLVKKAYKL